MLDVYVQMELQHAHAKGASISRFLPTGWCFTQRTQLNTHQGWGNKWPGIIPFTCVTACKTRWLAPDHDPVRL